MSFNFVIKICTSYYKAVQILDLIRMYRTRGLHHQTSERQRRCQSCNQSAWAQNKLSWINRVPFSHLRSNHSSEWQDHLVFPWEGLFDTVTLINIYLGDWGTKFVHMLLHIGTKGRFQLLTSLLMVQISQTEWIVKKEIRYWYN